MHSNVKCEMRFESRIEPVQTRYRAQEAVLGWKCHSSNVTQLPAVLLYLWTIALDLGYASRSERRRLDLGPQQLAEVKVTARSRQGGLDLSEQR